MLKNFLKNQEFFLDEVVFQGRNKDYGAYTLRADSARVLTRSMAYGIAIFGLVSAVPLLIQKLSARHTVEKIPASKPFIIKDVGAPEVPPPVTAPVSATPQVKTFDSTLPTPVHHTPVEKPAAKPSDYRIPCLPRKQIREQKRRYPLFRMYPCRFPTRFPLRNRQFLQRYRKTQIL